MNTHTVKEQARQLINTLPDTATWDDLMHEITVRQAIGAGLADKDAGRLTPIQDVRAPFGLSHTLNVARNA